MVCEPADAVEENHYNVSKHLHILENVGLLQGNKKESWVLYSVSKNMPVEVSVVMAGLKKEQLLKYYKRLQKRLRLRRGG